MATPTTSNRSQTTNRPLIASQNTPTTVSVYLRIGLPIGLAIMAAAMNTAAVNQEIRPVTAYELAMDLPAGTILQRSQLREVKVAGTLSKNVLVTPGTLNLRTPDQRDSFTKNSDTAVTVLSRNASRGELLTIASLGGLSTVQPGHNEGNVHVPKSMIHGVDTLGPGEVVYFYIKNRSDRKSEARQIGPFRVAVESLKPNSKNAVPDRTTIRLFYPLDEDGNDTQDALELIDAALSQGGYSLTVAKKAAAPQPDSFAQDDALAVDDALTDDDSSPSEAID